MFAGEPMERTDSEVSNASTEPELQGSLLPPREEWPQEDPTSSATAGGGGRYRFGKAA